MIRIRTRLLPLLLLAPILVLGACGTIGDPTYRARPASGQEAGVPVRATIVGNEIFAEAKVRKVLEDHLIDLSENPERVASLVDAEFDLQDLYIREGFPDVAVEITKETVRPENGGEYLRVTANIQQGPQVVVEELRLTGLDGFDENQLLALWPRKLEGSLGIGLPLFVENDLRALASSIRAFLISDAYLQAEVAMPVVRRSEDRRSVEVDIAAQPGPQYRFGRCAIEPELAALLGERRPESPEGEPARPVDAEEFRVAVLQGLRGSGYPESEITMELDRDDAQHLVDFTARGQSGRLARVATIEVRGQERTSESFIRDQLEFATGELYNGSAVDETLRVLYMSGLFRKVDITHEWVDDHTLRLVVQVEEDRSRSVDFLAGYGSYERFRGMVRFEERNLFGIGHDLQVGGRVSTRGYRGSTTWTDPTFLSNSNSLSISGEVFEREEPAFVDKARGVSVTMTERISEHWRARLGYAYFNRSGAEVETVDPNAALVDFTEGSILGELSYDRRDSLLFPRRGWFVGVGADTNDPSLGSDVEFVRLRFEASAYIPLTDRGTHLALRSSQAWLWPGEGSNRVPLQSRFYNGGENTVRSFREDRLGPLDAAGTPIGGEFRNVFTAELRTPLVKVLEGALFADAGNLGSAVDDFSLNDMRYALGFGLRLGLPIGPIRADAAYNPDRVPGEDEWVIHVSVGYPF